MLNPLGDDILQKVKKRIGKTITNQDISDIARQVKPSLLRDENAMRKIIKQVSTLAGIPVTEATTREIMAALKQSKADPKQLETLMRSLLGK